MSSFKVFGVIFLMSYQVFFTKVDSNESLVPAMYVFGDSSVDCGNNNNRNTMAKANKYPYGIDFNNKSTGRFTNGKTFADIIAVNLGLPLSPPYLGVSESERYKVITGINYASAACGILNDTRDGDCLSLDVQVKYFTSTVTNDLPKHFQSKDEVQNHLSKSLYLLSIGSNDYALNYFSRTTYQNKTPIEFADFLLEKLGSKLKELYDLGARKYVVAVAGQLGCGPSNFCDEVKNEKIKPLSDKLPKKLQELQTQLSGSSFISANPFNFFNEIKNAPEKYGFKNISKSCYVDGEPVCDNREEYYYFDFAHGTEANYRIYANECFSGSKLCSPKNIEQLVHAP
ncbi:hypothetical protein Lal_00036909 [Lupinus albus]|uniref:Putative triacylglycerol lipase n=1 Tax=Lupinus albus TaxID=3870 RepID=A0A6A5NR99_LUPAL|nr:putative triacylglycerol lipase [Lupinus albus]KAF1888867.1 hypothetical protein Lal_00036909 [Lupinus albus]